MAHQTWRQRLAPLIAEVIQENQGKDEATLNRALREAWGGGERRGHIYKVWRSEILLQTGKRRTCGMGKRDKQDKAAEQLQSSLVF